MKNNSIVSEVNLDEIVATDMSDLISFYVGRSDKCQIKLDDKLISREHLKVSCEKKEWYAEKCSEFGQVFINGQPSSRAKLSHGDIITFGPYLINVIVPKLERSEPQTKTDNLNSVTGSWEAKSSSNNSYQEPSFLDSSLPKKHEITETKSPTTTETLSPSVESPVNELDDFATSTSVATEENILATDVESKKVPEEDGFVIEEEFTLSDAEVKKENSDAELDLDATQPELTSEDNIGLTASELPEGGQEFSNEQNEEYPVSEYDEGTQFVKTFAKITLEIFGEFAPYDKYTIDANEIFIGRSNEKCQIVLKDPEVSAVHAVIKKNNVICTIEDLKSGNGTILNGERINVQELKNGDEFLIGSTTFTVVIQSDFLEQEANRLMPVDENQVVEVEEIVEVAEDINVGDSGDVVDSGPKSIFSKAFWKDPQKRKIVLYALVALLGAWLMFGDDETTTTTAEKKTDQQKTGDAKDKKSDAATNKPKKNFSQKDLEFLESHYALANDLFEKQKYSEAMQELEAIMAIDPDYKNTKLLYDLSKNAIAELEVLEQKRKAEEAEKLRKEKVKDLVSQAKVAVNDRKVETAEALFSQITQLDPENFDLPLLRNELEAWKREQERIAVEKAAKEAERKRQVDLLMPGKNYYLKNEWYKAVIKLEEFLQLKGMDEDLIEEASKMLADAKNKLREKIDPLLGKARSLKEGQDLKGAYEVYNEILKINPTHSQALDEMNEIREQLLTRARKIYREAIISESLSLFEDAKEKFQEVQQISPSDSEYYQKATEKLKEYLE